MNETKDNLNKLKLIFSSLFSRKMPYIVFGHTDEDDTLLFTNIDLESALVSKFEADQYIHKTILKDKELLNWFYEIFPVLKKEKCILNVKTVLAVLNKQKNDLSNITLTEKENVLLLNDGICDTECGTIIDDIIVDMYIDIFKGIFPNKEWLLNKEMEGDVLSDKFSMTEVVVDDSNDAYNTTLNYKVTVSPGNNIVATKEFSKKAKTPCCVKLLIQQHNKAIRVKYVYNSDLVYVESVCPMMLWFNLTSHKTNPETKEVENNG